MKFSIVEGKRFNSLNYISDGYRYTKYRELNETIYLRCTLSKKCACHGLDNISSIMNQLEVTNSHNHSRYQSDGIVRVKRAAESSTDSLREIFNNECRDSHVGYTLTLKVQCVKDGG